MEETKIVAIGAIRSGLSDRYSYNDIRMIAGHVLRKRDGAHSSPSSSDQ
jgi:hypothetical protein